MAALWARVRPRSTTAAPLSRSARAERSAARPTASPLDINNAAGASITAAGNDVVKTNAGTTYHIDNQGTIWAKTTTQMAAKRSTCATRLRPETPSSTARPQTPALIIRADGDDAIRPGDNTTITTTAPSISNGPVNTSCPDYLGDGQCDGSMPGAHDAIDVDDKINVTVDNYGTISGPRHGITADR